MGSNCYPVSVTLDPCTLHTLPSPETWVCNEVLPSATVQKQSAICNTRARSLRYTKMCPWAILDDRSSKARETKANAIGIGFSGTAANVFSSKACQTIEICCFPMFLGIGHVSPSQPYAKAVIVKCAKYPNSLTSLTRLLPTVLCDDLSVKDVLGKGGLARVLLVQTDVLKLNVALKCVFKPALEDAQSLRAEAEIMDRCIAAASITSPRCWDGWSLTPA